MNIAPDSAAMILQSAPTASAPTAAPTAPPQAAGHATPPALPAARQVAPFAVSLALGSDSSTSLVLEPAELGRVEVAIERNGSEAHVTFRADRPETLALLQRDRAELERALSSAGFGAGSDGRGPNLSFGLGGEGAGGHERRQGRATARGGRPQQIATIAAQPSRPRSLIDLAI